MKAFTIIVASDAERDNLFAEIWQEDKQWMEVILDPGRKAFVVEIFAPHDDTNYVCDLAELQQALNEAKQRLLKLGYSEG